MPGYPGFPGLYGGIPSGAEPADAKPADPKTLPLPVAPPADWQGREDRVAWVIANFTTGETAKLYRTLRDGMDFRNRNVFELESKERKALEAQPKKEVWP